MSPHSTVVLVHRRCTKWCEPMKELRGDGLRTHPSFFFHLTPVFCAPVPVAHSYWLPTFFHLGANRDSVPALTAASRHRLETLPAPAGLPERSPRIFSPNVTHCSRSSPFQWFNGIRPSGLKPTRVDPGAAQVSRRRARMFNVPVRRQTAGGVRGSRRLLRTRVGLIDIDKGITT